MVRRCRGRTLGLVVVLLGGRAEAQQTAAPTPEQRSSEKKIEEYLAAEYQNDTETRSRAPAHQHRVLADRVEQVLGNFVDIGGYFRAGWGEDFRGKVGGADYAPSLRGINGGVQMEAWW